MLRPPPSNRFRPSGQQNRQCVSLAVFLLLADAGGRLLREVMTLQIR
jgi:hypothetical protein